MFLKTKRWLLWELNLEIKGDVYSSCPFTQEAFNRVEFFKRSKVFLEGVVAIGAAVSLNHRSKGRASKMSRYSATLALAVAGGNELFGGNRGGNNRVPKNSADLECSKHL